MSDKEPLVGSHGEIYGSVSYDDSSDLPKTSSYHDIRSSKEGGMLHSVFYPLRLLFSQATFQWMNRMFALGNSMSQLSQNELKTIPLPPQTRTDVVSSMFERCWAEEKSRSKRSQREPSLARALSSAYGKEFLRAGMLKLIHDLMIFVGPQVLNGLIAFLREEDAPISRGLWLTAAVTISQLIMSLCLRQYFFRCFQTGLQLRTAVVTAVYNKSLVLSSAERQIRSSGEITNLMSVDAQRLQDLTSYLHAIWYSFLQIGLAIFFLWRCLGPSCLGGVSVIIIMIPVSKNVAAFQGKIQKKLMKLKDERVDLNNEVLGCMKIIKLQAWEIPFQKRIEALRNMELEQLFRYILFNALTITMWSTVPLLVGLATFATYTLSGNELDVASALTALALFDILRFPLFMLPKIINNIIEAQISSTRVRDFLLAKEYKKLNQSYALNHGIDIENGTFVYDSKRPKDITHSDWETMLVKSQLTETEHLLKSFEEKTFGENKEDPDARMNVLSLKRVNLSASHELVAVVGAVGSGKTTLINSILGEIRTLQGTVAVKGRVALCAQTPFIMNGTLKANVLFGHEGKPVNETRYQRALSASALVHDLRLLPGGDECEIGEKGVTLSGGQKARVALARALYDDADIYLLDDPLAAVDAHVGKHLFQKCIIDEMLLSNSSKGKKKTVILVTNALQYLSSSHVDRIVVLKNGRIEEEGNYAQLMDNKSSLFSSFLRSFMESSSQRLDNDGGDVSEDKLEEQNLSKHGVFGMLRELSSSALDAFIGNDGIKNRSSNKKASNSKSLQRMPSIDKANASTTLMTDEMNEREIGAVNLDVYITWAKSAGGIWVLILMIAFYGGVEGINVLSKWWLAYWSEHGSDVDSQNYFLLVYAGINLCGVICMFFRIFFVLLSGLRASKKIFTLLLDSVLKAPMSFFDTTPIGRIINRFSKDIYTVDENLPDTIRSYLATLSSVVGTIAVICFVTPKFIVCLLPISLFYMSQQNYFSKTYREIKRIDSVTRSPIYALFSETLDGVATIRAYGASDYLKHKLTKMLDDQQLAYFLTFSSQCWLAVRLELAGTFIVAFACLAAVLEYSAKGGSNTFAGFAGLSISFALSVTQSLNWSVRMASDLEAYMISVERINQYTHLSSENPRHYPSDDVLEKSWPSKGEILFHNVKMRYREHLPLVLKGLELKIPPHSKVGVVGRTGAGKSTIAMSLLRICEVDSGTIHIDGKNIREIGLQKLRSAIAVIPQDPVLFSGSVRSNIDPFNMYNDEKLIQVLLRVGLFNSKENMGRYGVISSLNDIVFEGGNNFSVGQKQLLVIARALLQDAHIIIMDEATAAVDAETDSKLQTIMRTEFKNSTCIIIAHRLNTIMDCDYILCMDDGRAAEFDSPSRLLQEGGLFKDLVDAWEEEHSSHALQS